MEGGRITALGGRGTSTPRGAEVIDVAGKVILPGLVETEFSLVRFDGDAERADAVYKGLTPLTGDDVADVIAFAATRPSNVNLDQIVIKPRAQYNASRAYRET